jgi:hypothetical protein
MRSTSPGSRVSSHPMAATSADTTRERSRAGSRSTKASCSEADSPSASGKTSERWTPIRCGSASSSTSATRAHWSGWRAGSHPAGKASPTA